MRSFGTKAGRRFPPVLVADVGVARADAGRDARTRTRDDCEAAVSGAGDAASAVRSFGKSFPPVWGADVGVARADAGRDARTRTRDDCEAAVSGAGDAACALCCAAPFAVTFADESGLPTTRGLADGCFCAHPKPRARAIAALTTPPRVAASCGDDDDCGACDAACC